jgi:polyphosphate glucokinase
MEALGIDIGGSGIKGAPVDVGTGELLAERHRIVTPDPSTPKAVARVVAEISRHFDWSGPIGCTFPAVVKAGITYTAANVDKGWIGTDAAGLLGEATGCEVTVLNDADAAGIAEMAIGAGKGETGLVFVLTVGTGLGTALFMGGILVPNTELGHLEYDGNEAEEQASDRARRREGRKWSQWTAPLDRCLQVYEDLFWPDLFIIGGGGSKKFDKFVSGLKRRTPIVAAQLMNEAGIVGAAMAATGMAGVRE